MADTVGFLTMADAVAQTDAPEIGVGMLGYAFMGKAHANALKKLPYMIYPPPAVPKLAAYKIKDLLHIVGRTCERRVVFAVLRGGLRRPRTAVDEGARVPVADRVHLQTLVRAHDPFAVLIGTEPHGFHP